MSRRDDVFSRVARGTNRRSPDHQRVRAAIQAITSHPDWPVVLDFIEWKERGATLAADMSTDHGALLRAAGRRSLLRELEGLDKRVIDDDRIEQRD